MRPKNIFAFETGATLWNNEDVKAAGGVCVVEMGYALLIDISSSV